MQDLKRLLDDIEKEEKINPIKCYDLANKLYNYSIDNGNIELMVQSLYYMAESKRKLDDIISANNYLTMAMKYLDNINNKEIKIKIYIELGVVNFVTHNTQLSYQYNFKALKYAQEINDVQLIAIIYNNLGTTLARTHNFRQALEYFLICLDMIENTEHKLLQILTLSNLSEAYINLKELDRADKYNERCYELATSIDSKVNLCMYYLNNCIILRKNGFLEEAMDSIIKSVQLLDHASECYLELEVLFEKAKVMYYKNNYDEAKESLLSIYRMAKDKQHYSFMERICPVICETCNKLGDMSNELYYYKEYYEVQKKIKSNYYRNVYLSLQVEKQKIKAEEEIAIIEEKNNQLENANQKLMWLSQKDELTELYNKRAFNEYIKDIYKNSCEYRTRVSIILIDIDHFKQYNDNYGHVKGDECIKTIARSIENTVNNDGNFVARYGGDEFLAVLCGFDQNQSLQIANNIRREIRKLKIEHLYSKVEKFITVSIGITSVFADETSSIDELLSIADMALYRAKRNGKDQVDYILID